MGVRYRGKGHGLNSEVTGNAGARQPLKTAAAPENPSHDRDWTLPGKPVGAVRSMMSILHAMHGAPRPMNASELARKAGLHRGTAYNILQTLVMEGVVRCDMDKKTYYISTNIFEMAHGVLRKSGLLDFVRPELFSLAEKCKVTVFLAKITDDFDLMVLDFVGGGFRIDTYFSLGRRSPRFSGAPGVLMAAYSSVGLDYVEEHYNTSEWFRRPPFEEFVRRIEHARRDGFSVDRGDRRNGLTQVAVPVFSNVTGEIALVITAIDYKRSFTSERVRLTADAAMTCADRISQQLPKLQLG